MWGTYNEQETTWSDPQVRQNLQQPEPTYNKQKKTRNDQQQADFEIILQYGLVGSLLYHVFPTQGALQSEYTLY